MLALATSVGLASSGPIVLAHAATHHSTTPTSYHFNGTPTVGALFVPGAYPASLHTCTASVIRSTSRDLIMTAAHCVTGTGRGYVFVPGYRNGKAPYGVWHVVAAYGSPQWVHHPHHQDTQRDWAFLRVANKTEAAESCICRTSWAATGSAPLPLRARRSGCPPTRSAGATGRSTASRVPTGTAAIRRFTAPAMSAARVAHHGWPGVVGIGS